MSESPEIVGYRFDAPWPYEAMAATYADRYPTVMAIVDVSVRNPRDTLVRVTGEREHVAHWVLVEYCGGDADAANEMMSRYMQPLTCSYLAWPVPSVSGCS